MYQLLRLIVVTTAITFGSFPASGPADAQTVQMQLTDKQIECFIAAQKDLSAALEKIQAAAVASDQDKIKYEAGLEKIIRKHGFKNFAEYELVSSNISLVMAAIDPQTRAFSDPHTAIKKEIEDVRADKTLLHRQREELLLGLNEALKAAQPIEFPTNIDLVKKYYDKIDVTIIAAYDGESRPTSSVVRTVSE
jgi:hypothetical protein